MAQPFDCSVISSAQPYAGACPLFLLGPIQQAVQLRARRIEKVLVNAQARAAAL